MHDRSRVKDREVIARRSSKFTVARDEKVTVTFPGRHLLAGVPCPLVRDSLSRPPHGTNSLVVEGKERKKKKGKGRKEAADG